MGGGVQGIFGFVVFFQGEIPMKNYNSWERVQATTSTTLRREIGGDESRLLVSSGINIIPIRKADGGL